jgi:archaellum component FlaC
MDLYFKKKDALNSGQQNIAIADVKTELEKTQRSRSISPKIVSRNASIITDRKVVYKNDLEDHKKSLKDDIETHITNEINCCTSKILELDKRFEDLKTSVENLGKTFESCKTESLKNALNECVRKFNENIANVSTEMITHLDKINSLDSRMVEIESIL